jgi:hypothetical protein
VTWEDKGGDKLKEVLAFLTQTMNNTFSPDPKPPPNNIESLSDQFLDSGTYLLSNPKGCCKMHLQGPQTVNLRYCAMRPGLLDQIFQGSML